MFFITSHLLLQSTTPPPEHEKIFGRNSLTLTRRLRGWIMYYTWYPVWWFAWVQNFSWCIILRMSKIWSFQMSATDQMSMCFWLMAALRRPSLLLCHFRRVLSCSMDYLDKDVFIHTAWCPIEWSLITYLTVGFEIWTDTQEWSMCVGIFLDDAGVSATARYHCHLVWSELRPVIPT